MPLFRKARIEVYLAVENTPRYRRLRDAIESEFLATFGGCTVIRGAKGYYLDRDGRIDADEIELVYTDAPFDFAQYAETIAKYVDELREVILRVTSEESVLIAVEELYHSQGTE